MSKRVYLRVTNSDKTIIKKWLLKSNKSYILGRSAKVPLSLEIKNISRKHLKITVNPNGSMTLEDLQSGMLLDLKDSHRKLCKREESWKKPNNYAHSRR